MNRPIVYPGQVPMSSDLLNLGRDAMIGLSKLAAAILGTNTLVNGMSVAPTSPASMQVTVAPGEIYQLAPVDGTQYGSLPADTVHQILKQGVLLDAAPLALSAPAAAGTSIAYLVQATFQEMDTDLTVLPFYNATNPTQAFLGQGNNGAALATRRRGVCIITLKSGTAAATGTQVTPAPDTGCVGLSVVTVAYGQTSITGTNITVYSGAPTLLETLPQKISAATGDLRYATFASVATAQTTANNAAPPGTVSYFAFTTPPAGWLAANGALVPVSQFTNLFNAIGYTFGQGNVLVNGVAVAGFGVPDLRGEFIRGWDNGRNLDPARAFGSVQADDFRSHTHGNNWQWVGWYFAWGGLPTVGVGYWSTTSATGGTETRPHNVALLPCIKY